MPTHDAYLLKQSSAQSLRDCPQLELPSQAGLCHQNTNNQAFSTDLIFTNWSIASNAQLSSRPLDFVMMHLMHKGGITTIVSCCRDMFMHRTYLNRNDDTETMGEHRINDTNPTLSKVASTLSLCSNTEATIAQVHIAPRDSPPHWQIIWCPQESSGSSTLKALSVPKIQALQAHCKFDNHVTEINHR